MNTQGEATQAEIEKGQVRCPAVVGDEWEQLCRGLPVDVAKLAKETKALQRKREIKSALDLLRLVLAYGVCDWSLRLVGAWATIIGLGNLSDVAVRKRLRRCQSWLGRIIGSWLSQRRGQLAQVPVTLRLIDASTISQPGSQGTDWRLHVQFDLASFGLSGVEVTNVKGGESLLRHAVAVNAIEVADRGYAHRQGLGSRLAAGVAVVVRSNGHNLPLETAAGQPFNLVIWLQNWADDQPAEVELYLTCPAGRFAVRLIARPLPPAAAEAARRRSRYHSRKKGHTPSPASQLAAGFILLVTNLPASRWPSQQVLGLYRLRWQVELLFKRLKSILDLDKLRAKEPVLAQVYLLSKLVALLLLEGWTQPATDPILAQWWTETNRPLSPWRCLTLWTELLRQAIRGPLTLATCLAALPRLARYLCDAPRKRRQQAASARHWLRAVEFAMRLLSPDAHHQVVLSLT